MNQRLEEKQQVKEERQQRQETKRRRGRKRSRKARKKSRCGREIGPKTGERDHEEGRDNLSTDWLEKKLIS
jgi:hypothetical protein